MDPLAITASSLQLDLQRMNVIANNAANALTPGFRRELLVAAGRSQSPAGAGIASESVGLPSAYVAFDNTPGSPRLTSSPLDLALLGDGYFEVTTPQGLAYTRQGSFHLDAQGRLVTQTGMPVSGVGGGDIAIGTNTPVIDREGKIYEGDKQTGQIKVVSFARNNQLRSIGGGLYIPGGDIKGNEVSSPRVAQGQLESSNVDSAKEMTKLVETYRHFEGSSSVLKAYGDMRDKTLSALGQF